MLIIGIKAHFLSGDAGVDDQVHMAEVLLSYSMESLPEGQGVASKSTIVCAESYHRGFLLLLYGKGFDLGYITVQVDLQTLILKPKPNKKP